MARRHHKHDDHRRTTAMPQRSPHPELLRPRSLADSSSCSLCTTTALSLASCSADTDYLCSCVTPAYGTLLSSCMATQPGCVPSDWISASSSISDSCSYWTESLGSAFCGGCVSSAVTGLGCTDYDDYACLCSATATGYVAAFSTCVAGTGSFSAKCPFRTSTSIVSSFSASCSSYASFTSANPAGCPSCQAAAADKVSCSGRFDYSCVCSKSYLPELSSCIASADRCPSTDYSIARSSYTEACSIVATGGTPTTGGGKSGAGLPLETGGSKSTATAAAAHGPRVSVIAAAAGAVVFLLAALVIGGYFLFRHKRGAPKSPPSDSVPLQPTNAANASSPPPDYKASAGYPQEADGTAVPGHPGYVPPPLPPGRFEAASNPVNPTPEWQAQGYMMNAHNKPVRGTYVELSDNHVPPPTPPQQPYYPQSPYQQQQQQYQRPMPGGGGNLFELSSGR